MVLQFYEPSVDHIEVYDVEGFKKNVLNSDKATIIEFYANWCGYSKNFIPHWKNFANETKLWHKNVIRVAAMDCYDVDNEICWSNAVLMYPMFMLYHARTRSILGVRKETLDSRSEQFMKTTIHFLENQRHPPTAWPKLLPYT